MRGSVRDISQIAAIFAYEKSGKTTKYTRAGGSSGTVSRTPNKLNSRLAKMAASRVKVL